MFINCLLQGKEKIAKAMAKSLSSIMMCNEMIDSDNSDFC